MEMGATPAGLEVGSKVQLLLIEGSLAPRMFTLEDLHEKPPRITVISRFFIPC